jgi:RHS repeat-associated protein
VTATNSSVNGYAYDANGNMIHRSIAGDGVYTLTYDAENRLITVKQGSTTIASFVYDGDGSRIKSTVNGVTTTFIGGILDWKGTVESMVKYYNLGGSMALRTGNTSGTTNLTYLLGDHLNSTSLSYRADTGATVTQLYKPWGEVRYSSGSLPTRHTYTGQYSYAGSGEFGLMFYNAGWYDGALGRFVQADSIVPGASPLAFDRYAYVLNSPLNHTDPSGHSSCINLEGSCPGGGGNASGSPIDIHLNQLRYMS